MPSPNCSRIFGKLAVVLILAAFSISALAHNSTKGLSAIRFKVAQTPLESQLAISFFDLDLLVRLDKNKDDEVTKEEVAVALEEFKALASKDIEFYFDDRRVMPVEVNAARQESNFEVRFIFPGSAPRKLKIVSNLLRRLTPDHQEFVTLVDAKDAVIIDRLLTPSEINFEYEFSNSALSPGAAQKGSNSHESTSASKKFFAFVMKGIHHILIDNNFITDHLLFLLALLIVCEKFKDVVKIITSFTIAHSLTLALAAFNVVRLPSRLVEVLIAATIIYVGLENLLKLKTLRWRWIVTFTFGLIHGFGFASSLREMVGQGSILIPLVSFNVGVEIGQILVAAVVLPIIWELRKFPKFAPRWVPISSVVVILLGGWWLLQRLQSV